ncbi:MAG: hypothetical protein LBH16_10870 [Treponema sp.]|jgi:hypothetical protein|nr:hypothetical protein [Treponema sp.]
MLLIMKNYAQKIDTARIMLIAVAAVLLFMPAVSESQQYYSGDGGRGVRVTVSELSGKGLSTQEQSILHFTQGTYTTGSGLRECQSNDCTAIADIVITGEYADQ